VNRRVQRGHGGGGNPLFGQLDASVEPSLVEARTFDGAIVLLRYARPYIQAIKGAARMSNYVQLGDLHTYYEEDGEGEALVLLHPGLADSRAFEEYVPEFAQHFHVFRPDRRGHGCTPDVEGPITYEQMARDTIAFLEQVVGEPAYLLGHSEGLPYAQLAVLPGAGHGSIDARIVIDFLAGRKEET
jgi:hypothetical protein